MTYCEMYARDLLLQTKLCVGVDIDIEEREEKMYISIFWHRPSINVGWYPICQIDLGGKTVFDKSGTENPEHWGDLLLEAADFLGKRNSGIDNSAADTL